MTEVAAKERVPRTREGMLKITEIFHSLQGEARQAGLPTVFVRLTGCPLRCVYCDSEYAFFGGEWMTFESLADALDPDNPERTVEGWPAPRRVVVIATAP